MRAQSKDNICTALDVLAHLASPTGHRTDRPGHQTRCHVASLAQSTRTGQS
jgi:hypothetical protein